MSNKLIIVDEGAQIWERTSGICYNKYRMATETSEEIKAFRVLPF